jgi:hypothetical protein
MSDKESVLHVATSPVTEDIVVGDRSEQAEIVMAPLQSSEDNNSMQVNLQTSGLAFQVRTQMPVNNQVIDLSARVELLTTQLKDSQSSLSQSMHRIGFLEAQLLQKQELIDHFCQAEKRSVE